MALYSQLKDLLLLSGLSEIAINVYLELLKKPANTIWELVLRTGICKSSVYRAFEELMQLKMVEKNKNGLKALSLKNLVADLFHKEKNYGKLAYKIKKIAPFLRIPSEQAEEFETFYDTEKISEAYILMSQLDYGVNLDFGDFENCVSAFGDLALAFKFRENRTKHAAHRAICTTLGPYTSHFMTKEAEIKFKNNTRFFNLDFKNHFVIFSDTNDYVLFCEAEDKEYPTATLIKSKSVATAQRLNFANFSRKLGNE